MNQEVRTEISTNAADLGQFCSAMSLGQSKVFQIHNIRVECEVNGFHGYEILREEDVHCKTRISFCDTAEKSLFEVQLQVPFAKIRSLLVDIIENSMIDENTDQLREAVSGDGNKKVSVLKKEVVGSMLSALHEFTTDDESEGPHFLPHIDIPDFEPDAEPDVALNALGNQYGKLVDAHRLQKEEEQRQLKEEQILPVIVPEKFRNGEDELTPEELSDIIAGEDDCLLHVTNPGEKVLAVLEKAGVSERVLHLLQSEDKVPSVYRFPDALMIDQHVLHGDNKHKLYDEEINILVKKGVFICFSNRRDGYLSTFLSERVGPGKLESAIDVYSAIANDILTRNGDVLSRIGNKLKRFSESIQKDPKKKRPEIKNSIAGIEITLDDIEDMLVKHDAYVLQLAQFLNQEPNEIALRAISSLQASQLSECEKYKQRIERIRKMLDEPKKRMMYQVGGALFFLGFATSQISAVQNYIAIPTAGARAFTAALVIGLVGAGAAVLKNVWWSKDGGEDSA